MQAPFWSQGLNRYSYVFNDPVNNTDPTGFVTGNDAAAMYAPFHVPAMTTMGALGSGLGFATGPLSVGTTLLGGGAGFAQAGGTVNVAARQAAVGGGTGQGGTHATAQNTPVVPQELLDMTPPEHLQGPDNRLACAGPWMHHCTRVLERAANSPAGRATQQFMQRHASRAGQAAQRYGSQAWRWAARKFARETATSPIDSNKFHHIFEKAGHNLGPLIGKLGSREAAFRAVESATQAAVKSQGLTGVFETTVSVGGQNVVVRGKIIDGVTRIGTFFIP